MTKPKNDAAKPDGEAVATEPAIPAAPAAPALVPTVLDIQAMTLDLMKAAIARISNEELVALLVIEKQSPEPRKGALEAIEAEMNGRMADQVAAQIDGEDEATQLRRELAEATEALARANEKIAAADAAPKPPRKREVKPLALEVDKKADFATAFTVVFGTPGGVMIAALPALEFSEGDFAPRGDGRVLMRKVEVPDNIAPVQIACIGLLDASGKVASVTELLAPIPAGGARSASFAARSILFRKP